MNELLAASVDSPPWKMALSAILIAYLLGQVIAFAYVYTHRGHTYSRSFVLTLVAVGVLSATLMMVIGGSLARGIGIVGALALVRFRTNLQDPLDVIFVLAAFTVGIAAGTHNPAIGAFGTAAFVLVVGGLRQSDFGSRRTHDGLLRLQLPGTPESEAPLAALLQMHCASAQLVTLREVMQGEELERIYQLTLKDSKDQTALVTAVCGLRGATGVTLSMQEGALEL